MLSKIKKSGLGIIFLFGCIQLAIAQPQYKQEFSFSLGGGVSSFYPEKMNIGENKLGINGNISIDYTCLFSRFVGITTGINLFQYNTKTSISSVSGNYPAYDGVEPFIYNYAINNLDESQQFIYLKVPLMLQFQTSGYNRFYFRMGGTAGLPVYQRYTSKQNTLSATGYYPEQDITKNLGLYENSSYKGNLDLDLIYTATIETGIKWTVFDDFYIYTGIYADYVINSIRKQGTGNKNLVDYNIESPYTPTINSMLHSAVTQDGVSTPFIDKINPVSLGIKIQLSFGFGDYIGKRTSPASKIIEYTR